MSDAAGATSEARRRARLMAALGALLAAAVLLPGLGARSLADWDEAIYAQVAREMLERGELVVPFYEGREFFEKPPLYFWATLAAYRILGVGELGARVGSAISGIALAALVAGLGVALGGWRAGAVAALALVTGGGFVLSGRSGMLDVPLALATWLAAAAWLRFRAGSPRHAFAIAAAIVAATMLKSAAGLIAPAGLALALAADPEGRALLRGREVRRAAALALLVAAAWPLAMVARFGRPFVDTYWGRHVLERALEPLGSHGGGPAFYLHVLPTLLGAWVWLLPVALLAALRRAGDRRVALPILLVGAAAVGVALAVRTRIAWYLLPALPAAALVTAAAIEEGVRARRPALLAALVGSAAVPIALAEGSPRLAAAAALAGGLVAALRWGRAAVAAGLVAALALVSLAAARGTYAGFRHPVAELAAAVAGEGVVASPALVLYVGSPPDPALDAHQPSALFYAQRPVRTASTPAELAAALEAGARFVLARESRAGDLPAGSAAEIVARRRGLAVIEVQPPGATRRDGG